MKLRSEVGLLAPIVLIAMLLQARSATATVITHCGASSGVTYYLEGGVMTSDKAGWQKDAVTGSFELVANAVDYSDADVTYSDPGTETNSSYRADGWQVTVLPGSTRAQYC